LNRTGFGGRRPRTREHAHAPPAPDRRIEDASDVVTWHWVRPSSSPTSTERPPYDR
jgi:hypothetical protein